MRTGTEKEQLICGICNQKYRNPKLLPCLHSFCEECLRCQINNYNSSKVITCSKCKTEHKIPNGDVSELPNDFNTNNLMDQMSLINGEMKCNACDEMNADNAVCYCEKCSMYFCEIHKMAHEKGKNTIGHAPTTINMKEAQERFCQKPFPKIIHCKKHQLEITLHCNTCDCLICFGCLHIDHKHHHTQNLSEAYTEHKPTVINSLHQTDEYEKELQDLIKEITELRKSLNLKHKLALKERKEVVDKMLKMVNEFSEHIDKEIGDNFNSKFLELNLKLKELNTQSDNIKNARHYVKGTLDQEDLVQVLSLKNTLVHRLEELNNRDILCCETDDCLEFKIKDNILEEVKQLINQVGVVTTTQTKGCLDEKSPVIVFRNEKDKICLDYDWLHPLVNMGGKKFKIELEDNETKLVVYSACGVFPLDISNTLKSSSSLKCLLDNNDIMIVTGKNSSNGCEENGYGIIIRTKDNYFAETVRLMVLPYLMPNGKQKNMKRKFKGWSESHEICFAGKGKAFGIDSEIPHFLGTFKIYPLP